MLYAKDKECIVVVATNNTTVVEKTHYLLVYISHSKKQDYYCSNLPKNHYIPAMTQSSTQPTLLCGAPVADKLYHDTKEFFKTHHITWYLAIFMMWDNNPSAVYVSKKIAYAEKLGLTCKIFSAIDTIYQDIESCNQDPLCLGILIQLPLPLALAAQKKQLLDAVLPEKDVDCLGERLLTISQVWTGEVQVAPATPAATLHLLAYYTLTDSLSTKTISVLWESHLIGEPLIHMLKARGAKVHSFNELSDQNQMRSICQSSDMIISATGKLHLVDEHFVRNDQTQIIIDIGRGTIDWKAVGDVDAKKIHDYIAAITPVPGWIGPVTVASIFWNMCLLLEWKMQK